MNLPSQGSFEGTLPLAKRVPGFVCIDHIAIATPQGALEQHAALWCLLGAKEMHRERVQGKDQVQEIMLGLGEGKFNFIQLLEPLATDSPVQRWIERNNGKGGLHHLGLQVENIEAAHASMQSQGFRLLDPKPRPGSWGTTVFFVHPKGLQRPGLDILLEVVQK